MASGHSYLAGIARQGVGGRFFVNNNPATLAWRNDPDKADTVPVEPYEQRLRTFVHMCQDFGIRPVLVTQPLSISTNS